MSLLIIKPGLLDTIQDAGRPGFGMWGINPGGVMDRYAANAGAMLVGNRTDAAVLEMHFPGPQILFEQNCLISLTGADFSPTLNGEFMPGWRPVAVRKSTLLQFGKRLRGSKCYLNVHGGFHIDPWLGSYSTNLKASAGGFQGRTLQKGDELCFNENDIYCSGLLRENEIMKVLPWQPGMRNIYDDPNEIYVLAGNEWPLLNAMDQETFAAGKFVIQASSDRMGYQLKGPAINSIGQNEMLSSGVSFGTVQLLPGGQMIVLMADHQTTGGYPRIAHVISAHLPKLAQLGSGDCINFKIVSVEKAESMLIRLLHELQVLQQACTDHLNGRVC